MPEVRHRRHRKTSRLGSFLRQYRFEIIWVAVVAFGIFLVFERMNIRRNALQWVRTVAAAALHGAGRLDDIVAAFLARTTVSDAIGYVLILGAVVALAARIRWRLRRSPRFIVLQCPKCGRDIHRIHRTRLDHVISVFVPVRRYRCTDRECRWQGLRVTAPKSLPVSKPAPVAGS